jgi:Domain of unknown function (DUF6398)
MMPVYEKIVGLTDDVCDRKLNSEYRDLARAMTAALCRKRPSPLASGQPRTWACGIVYVLGRINFLGDPSFAPHMTTAELCGAFEVGESTVHAKARVIERALGTQAFDPQWMLPSLVEKNPLVWMAEVNGLLVDLRNMPREVQEIAFEDGEPPAGARGQPGIRQGGLRMAAISHVFTLKYVAEQLGEDEEWLRDLHVDTEPEAGCLWVHGVGEDGCRPRRTDRVVGHTCGHDEQTNRPVKRRQR